MGIYCEINLYKPTDGAYRPGDNVTGVVKYAIDEDTVFKRITISLKGMGHLFIKDKHKEKRDHMCKFRNNETYVDVDNIVHDDEKGKAMPIGSYNAQFNFKLPNKIPPSFKYSRLMARYRIRCQIVYYIRIKFERSGVLSFDKRFKKDITVVSGIIPKLPMGPTVFGERKSLFQWFSNKNNTVEIKATVANCVIAPGGKLQVNCEVINDSKVTVNAVETVLHEIYNFKARGHTTVQIPGIVKDTDSKTASVKSGNTQTMDTEINLPSDLTSLENSEFVEKEYILKITAELPMPHRNAVLEIPIQIGDIIDEGAVGSIQEYDEPPPSYWEVMGEETKEKSDDEDDEEDKKGEKS